MIFCHNNQYWPALSRVQLNLAITDLYGQIKCIHCRRNSAIAMTRNKRRFSQGTASVVGGFFFFLDPFQRDSTVPLALLFQQNSFLLQKPMPAICFSRTTIIGHPTEWFSVLITSTGQLMLLQIYKTITSTFHSLSRVTLQGKICAKLLRYVFERLISVLTTQKWRHAY